MNRQEYMDTLKKALESFGDEIRDEIVSDYEEHFNMGAAAGKTDEQIAHELGSIDELVEELNILSGRAQNTEAGENGKAAHDSASESAEQASKAAEDNFAETAANTFTDMMNSFAGFLGNMVAEVSKGAVKASDKAAEKFIKAQEGLNKSMEKFSDKYGDKIEQACEKAESKCEEFARKAEEKFADAEQTIKEKEESFEEKSESRAEWFGEDTEKKCEEFAKKAESKAAQFGDWCAEAAQNLSKKAEEFWNSDKMSGVKDGAGKAVNGAMDGAGKIVNGVKEEADKFKTEFAKSASGHKDSVGEKAGRIAGKIASKTAEAFDNLSDKGSKFGENVGRGAEGVAGGFECFTGKIAEASRKFVDASTGFAKEIARGYRDAFGTGSSDESSKSDNVSSDEDGKFKSTFTFSTSGKFVNADDPDTEDDDDEAVDAQYFKFDENVANVVIDVDCANVEITGTDDGTMGFSYENHGTANQQLLYRFNMRQEGDVAYVTVKKQPGMTNFFKSLSSPDIELSATLPEKIQSVSVRTLSGDTTVDDLMAQSLRINSMSGDISLDNTMVQMLDINTMSGDVSMEDCTASAVNVNAVSGDVQFIGNADQLVAKTTSGDVQIECAKDADITAGSISGDVRVELTDSEGYVANVSSTTGDIILECGDERMEYVHSGSYVLGDGTAKVKCTTVSGDIDVNA